MKDRLPAEIDDRIRKRLNDRIDALMRSQMPNVGGIPEMHTIGHRTFEACIPSVKVIRHSNAIDADIGFFIMASVLMWIVEDMTFDTCYQPRDGRLKEIRRKLDAIEAETEDFDEDDPPSEYRALEDQFDTILNQYHVAVFRAYGEDEIADLFANDRDEFWKRFRRGEALADANMPEPVRREREARIQALFAASGESDATTPPEPDR